MLALWQPGDFLGQWDQQVWSWTAPGKVGRKARWKPPSCLHLRGESFVPHTIPFSLLTRLWYEPRPSRNLGPMTLWLVGLEKEWPSLNIIQGHFLYDWSLLCSSCYEWDGARLKENSTEHGNCPGLVGGQRADPWCSGVWHCPLSAHFLPWQCFLSLGQDAGKACVTKSCLVH